MNPVKAYGNHSIRMEDTELTAYKRGGTRLASRYYATEGSAERVYKSINSEKKLLAWVARNSKTKSNPRGAKRNPRTAINKGCGIPKGKRAGETFTKGGVKYRVVSYATKTGKRVRYARKV